MGSFMMVSATSASKGIMCLRPVPGNVVQMVIPIIMTVRVTSASPGTLFLQTVPGNAVLPGIPTTVTACVIPG